MAKFTVALLNGVKKQGVCKEIRSDGETGLSAILLPSGELQFRLTYTFLGRKRRMSLGLYDEQGRGGRLTLAEARVRYTEARKLLNDGIDPLAQKEANRLAAEQAADAERQAPTMANLLEEFWDRELCKKKSGKEMRRLLEKDVLPAWGKRKVKEITRRDIALLLDKVGERAPVTANRLHGRLTRLFNFACERGIIDISPSLRLRKTPEQARERVLSDSEIQRFWHHLEATGIDTRTALALRLILVTGQRPGEVSGMTWAEVGDDCWTIPEQRTKNGCRQRVPLTPLALDLLDRARRLAGDSAYAFPSPRADRQDRPLEVRSLSRAVSRHLDSFAIPKFVPHDLRRTVRTRLAELGIDDVIAERVLNHTLQGLIRVYNRHDYEAEKRAALTAWERYLKRLIQVEVAAAVSVED